MHQQPVYRSVPLIKICTFILNIKQASLSIHEINTENTNDSTVDEDTVQEKQPQHGCDSGRPSHLQQTSPPGQTLVWFSEVNAVRLIGVLTSVL